MTSQNNIFITGDGAGIGGAKAAENTRLLRPESNQSIQPLWHGPCQGRQCGLTAARLLADERKIPVADIDYYRIRTPVKPVTLAELASLANFD